MYVQSVAIVRVRENKEVIKWKKTRVKIIRINALSDMDTDVVNDAISKIESETTNFLVINSVVPYVYSQNNLLNRVYIITYSIFEEEEEQPEEEK